MTNSNRKPCGVLAFFSQVIDPVDRELARGTPRSPEYRNGVLDAYAYRALGIAIPALRYQIGTAQADAYFSGREHGHALWRSQQQKAEDATSTPSTHNPENP